MHAGNQSNKVFIWSALNDGYEEYCIQTGVLRMVLN